MNVNKKFGRFKQWAGEKMGGEVRTDTSDEFKALETEMQLRHEGMEKLQKSMRGYVKSLSTRSDGDDKEKMLPVGYLGSTMVNHGSDFDPDSEFGMCLSAMGRANERIARIQDSYVQEATSSWLDSADRSMIQMKEYQTARKRLEQRRLAYDTTLSKMQKAKREDYRVEEELRSQQAKYEDSSEEVHRRMEDIKEAETDSVVDLTAFVEAQLSYYEQCREVLLQLKEDWPASSAGFSNGSGRRSPRGQSHAAHSYAERLNPVEEPPAPAPKIPTSSNGSVRRTSSRRNESEPPSRPSKSSTFDSGSRQARDSSPAAPTPLARVPSEPPGLVNRPQLRTVSRDPYTDVDSGSPARSVRERSVSPATSFGSNASRSTSNTWAETNGMTTTKKAPPPPPPSRSKKPPPPPPVKRSMLSTSEVS